MATGSGGACIDRLAHFCQFFLCGSTMGRATHSMPAQPASWRPRLSVRWAALVSLVGYGAAWALGAGGLRFLFGLLFTVFAFVLALRVLKAWRRQMLWRLRNRLLITYLFIAVIPILLIVGMVALTAYMLYGQLAGYLIASDLESKARQLGALNLGLAAELAGHTPPSSAELGDLRALLQRERASVQDEFPGITLTITARGRDLVVPDDTPPTGCSTAPAWVGESFSGIISLDDGLFLHSVAALPQWPASRLCLTVPVREELLARVGEGIGPFTLILLEEVGPNSADGRFVIGQRHYASRQRVEARSRPLPGPRNLLDPLLNSFSKFDVIHWQAEGQEGQQIPVFVSITTRPSLLNQRIFSPLGDIAQVFLAVLFVSGVVFLVLQVISLVTGAQLTRRITRAIHDLYSATQRVQAGDFSVRVPVEKEDQLAALGASFNQMAASLERLVKESREKQRLQDELEIARQVQEQLFPREAPPFKTLTMVGACRPAQVVSGDYYDFGLADPGKLIFTIGDISGKGISAALLMATIQSILRTQVYACRLMGRMESLSVAELVARVNRQLCATTSMDKYSSLFVGFYDDQTRRLTYTNAGHLPPVVLRNGQVEKLSAGGTVVGMFRDAQFEEASVVLQPGDWLVAYTDGITEVENSYEEEFGSARLLDFLSRTADSATPERLIEDVLAELEEWAPHTEPSDDRTLVVARAQ
ncbi:MAG: PP2C family protein-serine/threonine phosphatase [Candidatus Acidiferrales bacterium]